MSTDQAAARDVDDVLASIDDVLADAAAPAPAPTAAPTIPAPATASLLVKDLTTASPTPTYRPAAPATAVPAGDWWSDIFESQDADLDTNTGRPRGIVPAAPVIPPPPPYPPFVPPLAASGPRVVDGVAKVDDADDDDAEEDDDQAAEEAEAEEAPAAAPTTIMVQVPVADANAPAPKKKGMSKRARQGVFALSTYAFGWGLGLHQAVDTVLVQAVDNAPAVGGAALAVGVLGLATRTKAGGLVFLGTLPVLTLTGGGAQTAGYAAGAALAAGSLAAYWRIRTWIGVHGNAGPWRIVRWFAFVPAAVTTTALILHGTN
jgi:hypothetical protein